MREKRGLLNLKGQNVGKILLKIDVAVEVLNGACGPSEVGGHPH